MQGEGIFHVHSSVSRQSGCERERERDKRGAAGRKIKRLEFIRESEGRETTNLQLSRAVKQMNSRHFTSSILCFYASAHIAAPGRPHKRAELRHWHRKSIFLLMQLLFVHNLGKFLHTWKSLSYFSSLIDLLLNQLISHFYIESKYYNFYIDKKIYDFLWRNKNKWKLKSKSY